MIFKLIIHVLFFILSFIFALSLYYFNIMFIIFNYKIKLCYLFISFLLTYCILIYKLKYNKLINEFYIFIFLLLYTICFFIIFITWLNIYLDYVQDFLINTANMKIQIFYTLTYKEYLLKQYFIAYVDNLLLTSNISEKQYLMLTYFQKNMKLDTFIDLSSMSITTIVNYIPLMTSYILMIYEHLDIMEHIQNNISYHNSNSYRWFSLIRNSLIIFTMTKTVLKTYLITVPNFILKTFFMKSLKSYVKNTLLNAAGVIFDMDQDTFDDFCDLMVKKLMEHYDAFKILEILIKNIFS